MPTTHELGDDARPSDGITSAVSTAEVRSPLDLPPLAWTVDPDALDTLLADDGAHDITFEYCGWRVTATPDAIHVESADRG